MEIGKNKQIYIRESGWFSTMGYILSIKGAQKLVKLVENNFGFDDAIDIWLWKKIVSNEFKNAYFPRQWILRASFGSSDTWPNDSTKNKF